MIVVGESVVRLGLSLLIMLALVLVIPTTTTLPVYASHDDQDADPETSDSGDSEDNNVATQDNMGTSGGSGGDSEDDDDSSNNIPQIQGSDNIPALFGEQGGDGNQPKFGTDECKKRGLIVASGGTFDRAQFIECSDLGSDYTGAYVGGYITGCLDHGGTPDSCTKQFSTATAANYQLIERR